MQIFSFRPETPFLDKSSPKYQNYESKLKFGTQTNSHMQNSIMMFTFSVFDQKYPFGVNLVQNCQFALKFGTYTNMNMQNSMVVFTFSIFNRKYLFGGNLVEKIKLISFSWNLVPRLIWICTIQWWCWLFLFSTKSTLFEEFSPKNQNYQFKLKFSI